MDIPTDYIQNKCGQDEENEENEENEEDEDDKGYNLRDLKELAAACGHSVAQYELKKYVTSAAGMYKKAIEKLQEGNIKVNSRKAPIFRTDSLYSSSTTFSNVEQESDRMIRLAEKGDLKAARFWFHRTHTFPSARYHLGVYYMARENYKDALSEFQAFQKTWNILDDKNTSSESKSPNRYVDDRERIKLETEYAIRHCERKLDIPNKPIGDDKKRDFINLEWGVIKKPNWLERTVEIYSAYPRAFFNPYIHCLNNFITSHRIHKPFLTKLKDIENVKPPAGLDDYRNMLRVFVYCTEGTLIERELDHENTLWKLMRK